MKPPHLVVSRRQMVAGTGALVLSFCSSSRLPAQQQEGLSPARPAVVPAQLPGSLKNAPFLDSWIRIPADGTIAVCTGKAELGQGIRTALMQVAAEELDVPISSVVLVMADTARTPNEGYTSGSQSMQESGIAIRNAAAQVRVLLMAEAGRKLSLPIDALRTENGTVIANDGRRLRYGEIVSTQMLHVEAQAQSAFKEPAALTVIGTSAERVDIPAKVTGGTAYVHDLRLPDMLHARLVRPPSYPARLAALDAAEVEGMPGVVKVV